MKKILLFSILSIPFNILGQNVDSFRRINDQRDIECIVNSYKNKQRGCSEIKYNMKYYNLPKILLLKNYKNEILGFFDPALFGDIDYYFLCFLGDLPDSIVAAGMKNNTTPLIFKAKHGDTASMNKLLSKIEHVLITDKNKEIDDREVAYNGIINLILLNTKRSKDILYKVLESSKYTRPLEAIQSYKESIAYRAINIYLAFNPPGEMASKIDPKQFEVREGYDIETLDKINKKEFERYVRDVESYISKKEKKKIKIKTTFFTLGRYNMGKHLSYPDK